MTLLSLLNLRLLSGCQTLPHITVSPKPQSMTHENYPAEKRKC